MAERGIGGFTAEQLREAGIDPGMVRVSVAVEDAADVIGDVDQAPGV